MASIRSHRTRNGQRRYEVRYRDVHGRQRSRTFSVHKDAQVFRLDVERRRQTGDLYEPGPAGFADVAQAWLERFERGTAGRVRPRPKTLAVTRETLRRLAPLSAFPLEQVRRPLVEDLVGQIAVEAPRRAEMALALVKRILRSAEERGHRVDHAVYRARVGKPDEREPVFLTWDEVDDLRSWLPEHIGRIVPIAVLTLCRQGELLGLRDRDVDFEAGAVTVRSQAGVQGRSLPKTAAGRRTVDRPHPVGPDDLDYLRRPARGVEPMLPRAEVVRVRSDPDVGDGAEAASRRLRPVAPRPVAVAREPNHERRAVRVENDGDRLPVPFVHLPEVTRGNGRAVDVPRVPEPVLEGDAGPRPERGPVDDRRALVRRLGALVAGSRGAPLDRTARALVEPQSGAACGKRPSDRLPAGQRPSLQVRVRHEPLHGDRPDGLRRMQHQHRRVACEERRQRGGRARRAGRRGNDDEHREEGRAERAHAPSMGPTPRFRRLRQAGVAPAQRASASTISRRRSPSLVST